MADTSTLFSINAPVIENMLPLFRLKAKPNQSSPKNNIDSLKGDWRLFLILFVSCQLQKGDLLAFKQHENQNRPPSLPQKGMLHSAVKSKLLDILEQGTNTTYEQSNADTVIMDDTTLINVFDMYHQDSFKSETRQKRGT